MGTATRTCVICGEVFVVAHCRKPKTGRIAVSCSEKCQRKHELKQNTAWRAVNRAYVNAAALRYQHARRWKTRTSDPAAVDRYQHTAVLDGTASWRAL